MERYCANLVLSWNTLVSLSMVIERFVGYSSLSCHLCSLRVCMRSAQDLLAFIVCGEMSHVILIGLPIYVVTGGISFVAQCIWSSVGFLYIHGHLFL